MVGGPLRKDINFTAYEFHPIKVFGMTEIEISDQNLFLDFIFKPPEEDSSYKEWENFCLKRKFPYAIAEGVLKPERKQALLAQKAKAMGKTLEEVINGKVTKKGHKDYSFGFPERIYGFFRTPTIQKYCGVKGEVDTFALCFERK